MDSSIDSLGNAIVFETLNWNSGYWQIPVAEEDKDKKHSYAIVGYSAF